MLMLFKGRRVVSFFFNHHYSKSKSNGPRFPAAHLFLGPLSSKGNVLFKPSRPTHTQKKPRIASDALHRNRYYYIGIIPKIAIEQRGVAHISSE